VNLLKDKVFSKHGFKFRNIFELTVGGLFYPLPKDDIVFIDVEYFTRQFFGLYMYSPPDSLRICTGPKPGTISLEDTREFQ
jgi:hypothetical protein